MSELFSRIQIIFEDNDLLVINKPAGLVVHADGRTNEATLCDWLIEKHPEIKGVGEPLTLTNGNIIDRPGIVHRIDRDTSGVLVVAKNQTTHQYLKKQFQDHTVAKTYNAFVYGELTQEDGVIDRPIGKSSKDFRLWSAQRGAKGLMREAITEYKVLKRTPEYSYIEAKPKTGRTHQIRVHFKAISHPLVCDPLYAPKKKPTLGFKRLALHARSISFINTSGQIVAFEADFPEDFNRAFVEAGLIA